MQGFRRAALSLVLVVVAGALSARVGVSQDFRVVAPEGAPMVQGVPAGDACAGGAVFDDGMLETGYSWVPSAVDGRYVQRFTWTDVAATRLSEICVCWTRTRPDDVIDFHVELYRDVGGEPAFNPTFSMPVQMTGVPSFPDGDFLSVPLPADGWPTLTPTFYVGVRWNPSIDQFFFVCADTSPTSPVVNGFFIDDRADGWASVLETNDPTFAAHHAMMIRAVGGAAPAQVPVLGWVGVAFLVALLAAVGVLRVRS
jgi:hypothetical protein